MSEFIPSRQQTMVLFWTLIIMAVLMLLINSMGGSLEYNEPITMSFSNIINPQNVEAYTTSEKFVEHLGGSSSKSTIDDNLRRFENPDQQMHNERVAAGNEDGSMKADPGNLIMGGLQQHNDIFDPSSNQKIDTRMANASGDLITDNIESFQGGMGFSSF
jgi:hypothetical protein